MDIQIVGEPCQEMHCSVRFKDHDYGDPECDFILRYAPGGGDDRTLARAERKPDRTPKPDAAERWHRWQIKHEDTMNDDPMHRDWARRGDGALMLQDEWGWFAMVTNGEGDIGAQSADRGDDPHIHTVYCEPVWLSWANDLEMERDHVDPG